MEKRHEYAAKITGAISEILNNEGSEWHIPSSDLLAGDNLTEFIHALATIAPAHIYKSITGDDSKSHLGFNHLANQLCFQYSTLK